MNLALIVISYYLFAGLLIIFSHINNFNLLIKISNNKTIFNSYVSLELLISILLLIHSQLSSNLFLMVLGFLALISAIYTFSIREESKKIMKELGVTYDYIGMFTYLILAALIYYSDTTHSTF
jgi:protein-S-isoprenylcysteine O-methyltransferase Ste14